MEDVLGARAELMGVIGELDQEMRRRVTDTARIVEGSFQEACRELFGGGEAGFSWLTAGSGGVELWVRPPGKRPAGLHVLSGGEKALGGLAWLFALLAVRPAPFVILDEAEASLDEANARRFGEYLAHHHDRTQYLVVTHHKATMEIADVLWGVSTNGKGVSQCVSVRLHPVATP